MPTLISEFNAAAKIMKADFKFRPISFSWVAIHPQPKGVILFIGGAFFGTFPTLFYRYFFSHLFAAGYTVIALPFRFTLRHWSVAISLLEEEFVVQKTIIDLAKQLGYSDEIYQDKKNYFWVGHSLGCKYIALLEILGDLQAFQKTNFGSAGQYQDIQNQLGKVSQNTPTDIKGQPSLLIAPDISDTESAIPVRFVASLLDRLGLGVLPTRQQTINLISHSELFNLTALISFRKDTIAGSENDINKPPEQQEKSDVLFLIQQLELRCKKHPVACPVIRTELEGKHLEPLGIKIGKYIVDLNPWDKFIKPIALRQLESFALQFLQELDKRRK